MPQTTFDQNKTKLEPAKGASLIYVAALPPTIAAYQYARRGVLTLIRAEFTVCLVTTMQIDAHLSIFLDETALATLLGQAVTRKCRSGVGSTA